jgi:hypothetical protein
MVSRDQLPVFSLAAIKNIFENIETGGKCVEDPLHIFLEDDLNGALPTKKL